MRTLAKKFKDVFTPNNQTEQDVKVNSIITLILNEETTLDSIILFQKVKDKFEQVIKEENIEALIKSADIENYFKYKNNEKNNLITK